MRASAWPPDHHDEGGRSHNYLAMRMGCEATPMMRAESIVHTCPVIRVVTVVHTCPVIRVECMAAPHDEDEAHAHPHDEGRVHTHP